MFRRIDGYLWRELLPTFGMALLAFMVFIGLDLVLSLSNTLFAHGARATDVLGLLLYKLPSVFVLAIPAGVLLAVFISLARLSTGRELLGFQALGYSLRRIAVPFVLFGLLASGVSFFLSELAVPRAEVAYRAKLLAILYRGRVPSPEEDVFFRGPHGELYYIARYQGDRAAGVVVYDLHGDLYPHSGPYPVVITAREGRFSGDELELFDGRVIRFDSQGRVDQEVGFDSLSLTVGEEIKRGLLGGRTPSEMSVRELFERVKLFRRAGLDPRDLVVELHSKLALSAAALVFTVLGAPLGMLLGRRGRAAGAVAGFVLVSAAQGLFIWTRTLAKRGALPPALGAWLPHILIACLGMVLLLSVDRLRVRGLLGLLVGVLVAVAVGQAAPPPFGELTAELLTVQSGAEVIEAQGVKADLKGWELSASSLVASWNGETWEIQAEEAALVGEDFSLRAEKLLSEVGPSGDIGVVVASSFEGSSSFQGEDRRETILFRGDWGRAEFQEGDLSRIEGKGVEFTTCPCFVGPPYAVRAERFTLIPGEWLYAEGVVVRAFGRAVGWLPVYAARLGKESSPLFPEIGRSGGDWFLRWYIPFAPREGMTGAVSFTWFPALGRADPGLRLYWRGGSLVAGNGSLRLSARGGSWQGTLSLSQRATTASFSGRLEDLSWSLTWGKAEDREGNVYWRLPAFSLRRTVSGWLGGKLGVSLSGGRYLENDEAAWKAAGGLSWSREFSLGPVRLTVPWQLSLSQYPGTQQLAITVTPRATAGGISLSYTGRSSWGSSPFSFDRAPPQSRLSLSLSSQEEGCQETLALNWDLAAGRPLPSLWTFKTPSFSLQGRFTVAPLELSRLSWDASLSLQAASIKIRGGVGIVPLRWDDLLVKARARGEGWQAYGAARLSPWPVSLKRVAASGEVSFGEEWALRAIGEYDFSSRRLIQLRAGLVRTFSGCLRLGLEVYLGGIRITLEVPAFPQARVSFAPYDEGLRLGD